MSNYCTNCGSGLRSDSRFCSNCGVEIPQEKTIRQGSLELTATASESIAEQPMSSPRLKNDRVGTIRSIADPSNRNTFPASTQSINGLMSNSILFVFAYILFMLPTYYLPYLGSNSAVVNSAVAASGGGLSPTFLLHALALIILVAIAWARGKAFFKSWLPGISVAAALFDILPGLTGC